MLRRFVVSLDESEVDWQDSMDGTVREEVE